MSRDRFPGATWAPLPESGYQGLYVKTQLLFHSTGTKASAAANRRYFAQAGVTAESTLIVDYDGGCLQLMGARERADANVTASRRAMSVEVVGTADEPYTAAQVAKCVEIAAWACAEHPVARRQCAAHDASGIGWHVMFGAPGPWTTVRGKECPGRRRIDQVRTIIIPSVAAPVPTPRRQEDIVDYVYVGNALIAYGPLGKRRVETKAEVLFWQAKGLLPASLAKVEKVESSPVLAAILAGLPWLEPSGLPT